MKIVHYSNFINHHMVWLADELYALTGGEYYFVCTVNLPESYLKSGYPNYFDRPYVVKAFEEKGHQLAKELALEADVAIFNGNDELHEYRHPRLIKDKLSFESGERWLKKGLINLLSPRLLKSQYWYHSKYYKCNNYYALCTSAYMEKDLALLHNFKGKCFKWGYFTKVDDFEVESKMFTGSKLMWVNRFIDWKHPEMPIFLAKMLMDKGFSFCVDMFGNGILHEKMVLLSKQLGLEDIVHFRGNMPNAQIIDEMRHHDIVMTTSDKNEGWGAVVNEAMSNGCVLVGSDAVGSVPFLVKHNENGLVFKACDIQSLCNCVESVLGDASKCKVIARNALNTMKYLWSPSNAAKSFVELSSSLIEYREPCIKDGPCSRI